MWRPIIDSFAKNVIWTSCYNEILSCGWQLFYIQNYWEVKILCAQFFWFSFFPGNILDGEHPTQPWLDGSRQPMKMDSVNLEDGIPAFDTMESSYPWLESIPRETLAINVSVTQKKASINIYKSNSKRSWTIERVGRIPFSCRATGGHRVIAQPWGKEPDDRPRHSTLMLKRALQKEEGTFSPWCTLAKQEPTATSCSIFFLI